MVIISPGSAGIWEDLLLLASADVSGAAPVHHASTIGGTPSYRSAPATYSNKENRISLLRLVRCRLSPRSRLVADLPDGISPSSVRPAAPRCHRAPAFPQRQAQQNTDLALTPGTTARHLRRVCRMRCSAGPCHGAYVDSALPSVPGKGKAKGRKKNYMWFMR